MIWLLVIYIVGAFVTSFLIYGTSTDRHKDDSLVIGGMIALFWPGIVFAVALIVALFILLSWPTWPLLIWRWLRRMW